MHNQVYFVENSKLSGASASPAFSEYNKKASCASILINIYIFLGEKAV